MGGLEQVSGRLFDGRASGPLVELRTRSSVIVLPRIEDLIADRLAQHAVAAVTDASRLEQARRLYLLATNLDLDYLSRRVSEEGGDISLLPPSAEGLS